VSGRSLRADRLVARRAVAHRQRTPEGCWRCVERVARDRRIAKPILSEPFPEYNARISPDGPWLAYISEEAGRAVVSVRLCGDDAAAAEGFSKATGVGAGLAGQSRWGARMVLTFRIEPGPEGITAASCSESHP
jgi:hypothetical protein